MNRKRAFAHAESGVQPPPYAACFGRGPIGQGNCGEKAHISTLSLPSTFSMYIVRVLNAYMARCLFGKYSTQATYRRDNIVCKSGKLGVIEAKRNIYVAPEHGLDCTDPIQPSVRLLLVCCQASRWDVSNNSGVGTGWSMM